MTELRSGIPEIAAEAVSDAVVLVDGEGRVTFINHEARRLAGFGTGDAAGKELQEVCRLVKGGSGEPLTDLVSMAPEEGSLQDIPPGTVLVTASGEELPVSGTVFRVPDHDGTGRNTAGAVFRDLSAEWLLDPFLRQSQRADALRSLARGASSNVNDLLTVLLARLSGIAREQGDRAAVLRHVRECRKLAARVSGLLENLSSGTPIGGGPDACLAGKAIETSLAAFIPAFRNTRTAVAYPDRTGYAAIHPALLEQALVNLLVNGGRSAGEDGTVTLTACRLELTDATATLGSGNYVMISVSDDGPGIPGEDLRRIFNPFYSAGASGYGLGLPAVRAIAGGCGGMVRADSGPGRGSRFTLYIPAAEGVERETEADLLPLVTIRGLDEATGDNMRRLLASLGCQLEEGGGERADVPSGTFGLLVTDLDHMTSEGGADAIRDPGTDAVLVLVDRSIRSPSSGDPRVSFLNLPVSLEELAEAVALRAWRRSVACVAPVE